MVPFQACHCALLECAVPVLQVVGVLGLCLLRLSPATRWAWRGASS